MPADDQDEHVQIGRQLGVFLRRTERFWNGLRLAPDGPSLDRGGYLLLAQLAAGAPQRLSALAEEAGLDLSTVSRQVAALEAAGLVSRTPDPTDRRATLIAASRTGHEVLGRNRQRWQAALRELLVDWTPAERAQFARLFGRFNEAMARREQEKRK
jgi:DNA-binding MarR family transcriptional regulator